MLANRCLAGVRRLWRPLRCPCRTLEHGISSSSTLKSTGVRTAGILGIETSCDDTGVAIVDSDGSVLGESLFSQQELHMEFGGIIPPLARDIHIENIDKVTTAALENAGLKMSDVDAIAVTNRPGLPLSLLVGLNHAKRLAKTFNKPLIPVHHMEAHALTIRMVEKVEFPFLVLLISGGHCLIAIARKVGDFLLLGSTIDDAPGEAFDKIGRRLKLRNLECFVGMSGGQAVETAASKGDPLAFPISEPLLHYKDCNFSFSGIKNSSRSFIVQEEEKHGIEGDEVLPNVNDLCASVQLAVTKHLCRRVGRAIQYIEKTDLLPSDSRNLVVSGGVACNGFIGKAMKFVGSRHGYSVHIPPRHLCTDNGVMIAWNGVEKYKAGLEVYSADTVDTIDIHPKCPLGEDISDQVLSAGVKSPPLPIKDLLAACSA